MMVCPECGAVFSEPTRRTWWEKIDGENWCEFSDESCPYCGGTEIYEPSEYAEEDYGLDEAD